MILLLLLLLKMANAGLQSMSFVFELQGCNIPVTNMSLYAQYWNTNIKYSVPWFYSVYAPNITEWNFYQNLNPIYSNVIQMPCAGISSNLPYNFSKQCGMLEIYAMRAYAKNVAIAQPNRLIYLNMPQNCLEYGIGIQGCLPGSCDIWISSLATSAPIPRTNTLLHEIGHTYNLMHASSSDWEYGDCSCIMGCAADAGTGYNAPNANFLGMAFPVADIADSSLGFGQWNNYLLPIFTTSIKNHIRISLEGTTWKLYLSARSKDAMTNGADSNLDVRYDKVLSVHAATPGQFTYIVDMISPGNSTVIDNNFMKSVPVFNFQTYVMVVKLVYLDNTRGALVSVCRATVGLECI